MAVAAHCHRYRNNGSSRFTLPSPGFALGHQSLQRHPGCQIPARDTLLLCDFCRAKSAVYQKVERSGDSCQDAISSSTFAQLGSIDPQVIVPFNSFFKYFIILDQISFEKKSYLQNTLRPPPAANSRPLTHADPMCHPHTRVRTLVPKLPKSHQRRRGILSFSGFFCTTVVQSLPLSLSPCFCCPTYLVCPSWSLSLLPAITQSKSSLPRNSPRTLQLDITQSSYVSPASFFSLPISSPSSPPFNWGQSRIPPLLWGLPHLAASSPSCSPTRLPVLH